MYAEMYDENDCDHDGPPTAGQLSFMRHNHMPIKPHMTFCQAWIAIHRYAERPGYCPPTIKQKRLLLLFGRWREGMTRSEAFELIGELIGKDHTS